MIDHSCLSIEDLVKRCSSSPELDVWQEFVRRFHRLIATVVLRTAARLGDASKQTVDDLIQDTYMRLCANDYGILRNFEHRHPDSFLGFVKVMAANVVRDHFKSKYAARHGSNRFVDVHTNSDFAASDDAAGGSKELERTVLLNEIEGHLSFCVSGPNQERSRRVFLLYYRVGLSARDIATLPEIGLTTEGVESLIFRTTAELRKRLAPYARLATEENRSTSRGNLPRESL